ncbi:MAG TPA: M56 family metallopeptidase [Bacteroidales bacterium]|jgi:beta-lactamase regulating signal transducer with metallopeptidase domain|nr:M56 family metallopeptidase [Bacteroidales bacterium]
MSYSAYMIVSSACICISYLLFILVRTKLWFLQQRIFLMVSAFLSLLLPFSHATIQFPGTITGLKSINQFASSGFASQVTPANDKIRVGHFLLEIYLVVACILTLVIILQILHMAWLYSTAEKSAKGTYIILRSKRIKTPFSFFRWIFIPSRLKDAGESESVFIHESVHSGQYHSVDNLVLAIICAIMWFNPFIWLIKKSLHLIHEYLADEGTLRRGVEKTGYQALLINQAAGSKLIIIPSGFNNLLKKRIIMMTKPNKKESGSTRILSVIPLPFLLLIAVSIINGLLPGELNAQKNKTKTEPDSEIVVIGYGRQKQDAGNPKNDTVNYIVDGVRVKSISDINPDSIESVNVLKDDNTIIIRTKGFSRSSLKTKKIDFRSLNGPEKILYILDEREISEDDLKSIPPENIESVSVLKHDAGIKKYTTKDYDGVIIVTSKKK